MNHALPKRVTTVWLVLVAVTAATFWLGTEHPFVGAGSQLAPALALGGAFVKAFLVGWEFMEVRGAPTALRVVFGAWIAAFAGLTFALLLI